MKKRTLLPPNSSTFEQHLEQVSSRIDDIPAPIRDLFSAEDCPAELLPWLAWSLSIDSWKDYWPEHIKRARIKDAIKIAKSKGTRRSIESIVKSFGGEIELKEWYEQDTQQVPFSFNILLNINNLGAQTAAFLTDIVNEIKKLCPRRSQFEVRQGITANTDIKIGTGVRVAKFIHIKAK